MSMQSKFIFGETIFFQPQTFHKQFYSSSVRRVRGPVAGPPSCVSPRQQRRHLGHEELRQTDRDTTTASDCRKVGLVILTIFGD